MPYLTALSVKNAKPREKRYSLPDSGCRGLYLNVHPTGHKSWSVRYVIRGRHRNLILDGSLSLGEARVAAAKTRGQLMQGIDPAGEKHGL